MRVVMSPKHYDVTKLTAVLLVPPIVAIYDVITNLLESDAIHVCYVTTEHIPLTAASVVAVSDCYVIKCDVIINGSFRYRERGCWYF